MTTIYFPVISAICAPGWYIYRLFQLPPKIRLMNYTAFHTNEIHNDKICVQIQFRLQLAHNLLFPSLAKICKWKEDAARI